MKRFLCLLVVVFYLFVSLPFAIAEGCGHNSSTVVHDAYEHYEHIMSTLSHRIYKVWYWRCSVCGEIVKQIIPDDFITEACDYVVISFIPKNLFYDSSQHWYVGTLNKDCSGCHDKVTIDDYVEIQNHSRGQAEDAGHVGVYHYFTFHCAVCGYLIETVHLPCPGGSNHIGYTSVPTDPNLFSE